MNAPTLFLLSSLALLLTGCTSPDIAFPEEYDPSLHSELTVEDSAILITLRSEHQAAVQVDWKEPDDAPYHVYAQTAEDRTFGGLLDGWDQARINEHTVDLGLSGSTLTPPGSQRGAEFTMQPGDILLVGANGTPAHVSTTEDTLEITETRPSLLRLVHSWEDNWNHRLTIHAPLAPGALDATLGPLQTTGTWVHVEMTIFATQRDVHLTIGNKTTHSTGEHHDVVLMDGQGPVTVDASVWHWREPLVLLWVLDLPTNPWT